MRQVDVYCDNDKAGTLAEVSPSEYLFRYEDSYFADASKPPISLTLSKKQQTHSSPVLFPFFSNILPEGANRKMLCTFKKVDEHDLFGILMAIRGTEFIGNVSVK